MKSIETAKTHSSEPVTFTRTFRDLSDDEIKDPETLTSLTLLGWSGSFDWSELLKSERIMLLSEAGTGKTYECRAQAQRLNDAGVSAFFLPLEALARDAFDNILSPEEARRFQAWRSDASSEAWFFLDSIDEMILSHGKFRTALRQLARAIDGQLKRARIVVTSRPIPIDAQTFADELPIPSCSDDTTEAVDAKHYFYSLISGEAAQSAQAEKTAQRSPNMPQLWRTVALMPLSNSEIRTFVTKEGVDDSGKLVTEIEHRRMWDFARRPQDLIEICAYWKEHKALGSRAQQVAQNIANKLREVGERRHYAHLSDARALEGAERLALAMVLTRKKTIRISDNSMDAHEAEAALDPNIILSDWSDADRLELLQRPLFGFSSYGRVRFHHRSVFEYLAARRLQNLVTDKRMPMKALYRLLFAEKYSQQIIYPSMRPIVAWLSLWNSHICSEAIEREPEVLMDCGDPESLSLPIRNTTLSAFVKRYSAGGWRGIHISVDQVRRFADPKLSPVVRMCPSSEHLGQMWS